MNCLAEPIATGLPPSMRQRSRNISAKYAGRSSWKDVDAPGGSHTSVSVWRRQRTVGDELAYLARRPAACGSAIERWHGHNLTCGRRRTRLSSSRWCRG